MSQPVRPAKVILKALPYATSMADLIAAYPNFQYLETCWCHCRLEGAARRPESPLLGSATLKFIPPRITQGCCNVAYLARGPCPT
jgi:hypothetical protein